MDFFLDFDWLQWVAMAVTVGAAWLTGSTSESKRRIGFWVFLLSNGLWTWWAFLHSAWALLVLQAALAFMNVRGAKKNASD